MKRDKEEINGKHGVHVKARPFQVQVAVLTERINEFVHLEEHKR